MRDVQSRDTRIKLHELGLGLLPGVTLRDGDGGLYANVLPPKNRQGYSANEIRSALGNGVLYSEEVQIPGGTPSEGVLYWVSRPYPPDDKENLWGQIFEGLKITGPALLIRKELAP